MGLGTCIICRNEEFIYYLDQRGLPFIKICDKCKDKLLPEDWQLLNKINLTFQWEMDIPNKKDIFRKKYLELAARLKSIIYSDTRKKQFLYWK